jgi:hypothetical protein
MLRDAWHMSHTTKMGSPTLVLITHFAAEIMLIAFLNQECERRDCLLHVQSTSYRPPVLIYVGLCFHIVRCNTKDVGDREILETYLNSVSKNT